MTNYDQHFCVENIHPICMYVYFCIWVLPLWADCKKTYYTFEQPALVSTLAPPVAAADTTCWYWYKTYVLESDALLKY